MLASELLPDLSALTLLVVEDDVLTLEGVSLFFKACGALVLEARTAARALAHIDATPTIDVVITDLSIAAVDGVELVEKFRRHPSLCRLRAIALANHYEKHIDGKGFDAFLFRPLKFAEVCKVAVSVAESRQ
jgi:CheY-like chemotaxis protein